MAQGWKHIWTRLECLRAAVLKEACTAGISVAARMEGAFSVVQCLMEVCKSSNRLGKPCNAPAPALKCRAREAFTGLESGLRRR